MSDFNPHTRVNMDASGVGTVEYGGGPQGQLAIFYTKSVIDPVASAQRGAPIHKNVTFVRISPPGERLNIIDRPATAQDKFIWARQYAQFEQNQEQRPEGTPIELLYPENPAVCQNLRGNGVHTVQQLANLSANAIETIGMGTQDYVNAAKFYLKNANEGAGVVQLRKEMEALTRDKAVLERRVQEAIAEIERLKQGLVGKEPTVSLTQEQLQALIAGAQVRPEMPRADGRVNKVFDATEAQINANHPTKILSEGKTKRKREKI